MLEIVETAHRAGVKVRIAPKTTDLLLQRGEYVPGQGMPLFELRPPVFAGTDWVVKRAFDLVVSSVVVLRRAAAVAPDRAGDQARLARAGPVSRPADRRRRAGVRDAQVPDDGGGGGGAAGRARGPERGGGRAVQDSRGSALDARRQVPAQALARRAAAGAERPRRRDEPRRPAAAAGAGLRGSRPGTASATTCFPGSRGSGRSRDARRSRSTISCGSTSTTSRTGRSGSTSRSCVKTLPAVIARRGAY